MCGGNLNTYARLAFGDHRIKEAHRINTFFQKHGRHLLGQFGISQHDGNNGMGAGFDAKTGFGNLLSEKNCIGIQLFFGRF